MISLQTCDQCGESYVETHECHADEGPLGEPAARSILAIALKYARIVAGRDTPQRITAENTAERI